MRSTIVSTVISVLLLSVALAQTPERDYGTCEGALELDPFVFITLYYDSEIQADMAAGFWADCRAAANEALLEGLPQPHDDILRLRHTLGEMATAMMELNLTRWGGGTLYPHMRSRYQPEIEAVTERLIRLVGSDQANLTSDVLIDSIYLTWGALERDLGLLQMSDPRLLAEAYAFEVRGFTRNWLAALGRYEAAYAEIKAILNGREDVFAYTFLEFAARDLREALALLELTPDAQALR